MNRVTYKECRETKGAMGFIELGVERDLGQDEDINEAWDGAKHQVREQLDQAIREEEAEKRMKGEGGVKGTTVLADGDLVKKVAALKEENRLLHDKVAELRSLRP